MPLKTTSRKIVAMIVINIKDGYNINRRNVKYNFVTDEKLWLFS